MILDRIRQSVAKGNYVDCAKQVSIALEKGVSCKEILDKALIAAMLEVGQRFKNNEIFVPELMIAARAMQRGIEVLEPHFVSRERKYFCRLVLGTVKGDLHDIGKNLVKMMSKGVGIEVIDLGVNVPSETFVAAVIKHQPQFLGLSALLTPTMSAMADVIEALQKADARKAVKVLVGGAPVTQAFSQEIGADGYAPEAASAADMMRSMLLGTT